MHTDKGHHSSWQPCSTWVIPRSNARGAYQRVCHPVARGASCECAFATQNWRATCADGERQGTSGIATGPGQPDWRPVHNVFPARRICACALICGQCPAPQRCSALERWCVCTHCGGCRMRVSCLPRLCASIYKPVVDTQCTPPRCAAGKEAA